jgi:hypothetical protein
MHLLFNKHSAVCNQHTEIKQKFVSPVGLQILFLCVAAGSPPDVLLCLLYPQDILRVPRLAGPQDIQLHRTRRRQQRIQMQRIQIQ